MRVSDLLCKNILSFLAAKRLITWRNKNKAGTYFVTHTLNFSVRQSIVKGNPPRNFLQGGGRYGADSLRDDEERERLQDQTPTINQMYFWIAKKYKTELFDMSYSLKDFEPADLLARQPSSNQ